MGKLGDIQPGLLTGWQMPLMKLNILSDLHLSCGALEIPRNDADIVILAGDIARPKEAVSWASGFAKPVLYVAGNREVYGASIVGASQDSFDDMLHGARLVCNPRGYAKDGDLQRKVQSRSKV